jgi:hypothetical protein
VTLDRFEGPSRFVDVEVRGLLGGVLRRGEGPAGVQGESTQALAARIRLAEGFADVLARNHPTGSPQ